MRLLTADEFQATTGEPHLAVGDDESPPFDFWSYFGRIPVEDFRGHDFSRGQVTNAWRTRGGAFEHVLIRCETANVFLVLVLDLAARNVHGHHLLDLNRLYSLADGSET
ncbi:hypothetical protein [Catellatospora sp. IY07-71]|uniref:hypothetical protein n=1 Tax=Catellatospora sp. IY07-71 TaxID=2728827 RepID=UPI001BB41A7C|nr:hypothetical protein [Catellatospora sp. IY07-71]